MEPMLTYRFVWDNNWPCHMTVAQYEAACKVAHRFNLPYQIVVQPVLGTKAILIKAGGMFIGVEEDGYTHT